MGFSKRCSRCLAEKGIEHFGRDSHARDGLTHACKACIASATKRLRAARPDVYRAIQERNNLARRRGGKIGRPRIRPQFVGPKQEKLTRQDLEGRFWRKVRITDGCWNFGAKNSARYGTFMNEHGKTEKAHRVSWRIANGLIPPGLLVCHHCDNPSCVRPSHLFLGTHKDNTADQIAKGRKPVLFGETHPLAALTESQVLDIRRRLALGAIISEVAKDFPIVTLQAVAAAGKVRSWRHLS